MSAYLIAKIEVTDPEQYKQYTAKTPGVIEQYGGKFIVRGGEVASLEGPEVKERMVVLEFDTLEQAKTFYHSPEYTEVRKLREGAAQASMIVVEGV